MNWVDVKEKMPEPYEKVLALFLRDGDKKEIFVAYMNERKQWNIPIIYQTFPLNELMQARRWMPLPELPEVKS